MTTKPYEPTPEEQAAIERMKRDLAKAMQAPPPTGVRPERFTEEEGIGMQPDGTLLTIENPPAKTEEKKKP